MRKPFGGSLRASLLAIVAVVVTIVIGGFVFTDLPERLGLASASPEEQEDHEGHDHGASADDQEGHSEHDGHSDADSIQLSDQARANLGLTVQRVSVGPFTDYIEIPAAVVEWPGRTHLAVTSPLTGVINAIYVSRGELVTSGSRLFDLRLTHQDLVETQEQFLTSLGQLDVAKREISRLTEIASSGAIAGKTLLNREYERDRLLASIRAAKQSMLLHGLTEEQINSIEQKRELVREVTVYAPTIHADRSLHHDSLHTPAAQREQKAQQRLASVLQPPPQSDEDIEADFLVTQLETNRGQAVQAGEQLGQLSDYSEVLIEGFAYQRDGETIRKAAESKLPLQAVLESTGEQPEVVGGLQVAYIGSEVNRESRALSFFVSLPNQIERSEQVGEKTYVSWKYKPGQRLTLRVPVAGFEDAIIVPKSAVAEEGPERYVFVENNDHFDRIAVHVLASDSINIAIANDGQVWPGQSIAVSGAHQLQMALKNQSGGGVDPHAGHNH